MSPHSVRLALSPQTAEKLRLGKIVRGGGAAAPGETVCAVYYDTPRHVLRRAGMALRVVGDDDGGAAVREIVRLAADQGDAADTVVSRRALADGRPDLEGATGLPKGSHRGRLAAGLRPVFEVELTRIVRTLRRGKAKATLTIDEGALRTLRGNAHISEPVCEALLVLRSGDPAALYAWALEICEGGDGRLLHRGLAERGYALARPSLRPEPVKAPKVELVDGATTVAAFGTIVRGALDHLYANDAPTLRGHPEGIHQTRVAMRRLRAALRAFKAVLPYDSRKAFNGEFRWFQQRLSPARDWYVFLDETLPRIVKAATDPARVRPLEQAARRALRMANRDAAAALQIRRYTRLLLRFEAWLAALPDTLPDRQGAQPARKFAKSVLGKSRRDLLSETRPVSRLSSDAAHALRIRGKKARYASEFFSPLFPQDRAKPYVNALGKLQDRLGEANDTAVARHLMARLAPGQADPVAALVVEHWAERHVRDSLAKAQPHWRILRRLPPFWESDG